MGKPTFIITKKREDVEKAHANLTMISTETQFSSVHPNAIFLEPSTVQKG
jgi:hypothetical protein